MNKNQEERIIGVDIHPYCIAAAAFNLKGEKLWLHNRVEMYDLKHWLYKNITSRDTLVIEACNNSFEFARIVSEHGAQCVVLNSIQVGQIGKAYCKTDKEDSVKIAKIYLSGLTEKIWQPDQKTTLRREVLKKYQQANKAVTKCKNMLRSYLTEHTILKPSAISLYSEEGRSWLKRVYKWDLIQIELIDLMFDDLFHAVKSKKKLKNIIARDVFNDPKALNLMKLCGIRSITAFAMIAAIGDINRFSNPKKLAAYLGLIPSVNQSGENIKYGGIGKGGRKETRTFMIQGAHSVLASGDEYGAGFKKWGWQMTFKKGKNVAVTAIARKMAMAAWYQLKGFETNITIPNTSLDTKINKLAAEIGKEEIKKLGFEKSRDFKLKVKEKMLGVA